MSSNRRPQHHLASESTFGIPPKPPVAAAAAGGLTSSGDDGGGAPLLTNASIALAEFTSMLRPADSKGRLREHIATMLKRIDSEETLVRLAKALESAGAMQSGNGSGGYDSGAASESTTTTTAPTTVVAGASPGLTQALSSSSPVRATIEESIIRSHLEHQQARQHGGSGTRGLPRGSAVSFTDASDGAASSFQDDYTTSTDGPPKISRRRSYLGAAALGLGLFMSQRNSGTVTSREDDDDNDRDGMHDDNRHDGGSNDNTRRHHRQRHRRQRHHEHREAGGEEVEEEDDDDTADPLDRDAAEWDAHSRVSSASAASGFAVDPLLASGPAPVVRSPGGFASAVRREGRRVAVSAAPFALGAISEYAPRVIAKTPAEQQVLGPFVKSCHLFAHLEDEGVQEIVLALERETYPAGTAMLEQGEPTRDCLFLLTEGTCEAIKNGKVMGGVTPGAVFGELELMYKQALCAATIRCVTKCTLYTLDEETYRRAVMAGAVHKRQKYSELTKNVPFLKCLPEYERMKVAEALTTRWFKRDSYVIRFGTQETSLHFIVEGEVRVVGRNQGMKVEVVRLHVGDVVGELEFLFSHLTVADVIVTSRRLVTACISRKHFELILGPIQDRLKEFIATSPTYESYYLTEIANASVRSEVLRAGDTSQRKRRRRVASSAAESGGANTSVSDSCASGGAEAGDGGGDGACVVGAVLRNVDVAGEIVMPAKRSLLRHFTEADLKKTATDREKGKGTNDDCNKNGSGGGENTAAAAAEALGENPLVFRFPLLPVSDSNKTLMIGLREDGVVLSWNEAMARLTSYPASEVIGQNIYSFLLESHEQQAMYQAMSDARSYAGDVEGYFADHHRHHNRSPNTNTNNNGNSNGIIRSPISGASRTYTFARSDGLTRAVARLYIIPPVVSSGDAGADMLLAYGEEVKQSPHQVVDQAQWLSGQIRNILADGNATFEDRLQLVAEAVNTYEATYRALTMSTERLRVVNIRQMLGQVMMDCGAECVAKGISVRQRFEGLGGGERAYLDAELLPECLRFAATACLAVDGAAQMAITVTLLEKNGLEFLVLNFNVDGVGFSADSSPLSERPLAELIAALEEEAAAEAAAASGGGGGRLNGAASDIDLLSERQRHKEPPRLTHAQKQQLLRVREVVEEQGGTVRVQRNTADSNLFFLIPFMPAGADEAENASVAESISNAAARDDVSTGTSCTVSISAAAAALCTESASGGRQSPQLGPSEPSLSLADFGFVPTTTTEGNGGSRPLQGAVGGAAAMMNKISASAALSPIGVTAMDVHQPHQPHQEQQQRQLPTYNFTTLVAEDTPAHRNMLCSYLWERRHAVLPAHSFADIDRLTGVADILFIDLHQSIISSLTTQDPIALLREKARQMAVVITARSFDDGVSAETYQAAGFVTLKKPCTPIQAMQAIRRAEEKIFAAKQEAERIAQARETLARNSRGAWTRGQLLGKGTFGEVFEAVDVLTGGTMAVKEMRVDQNASRIEAFVEEVATMCSLKHPNIIHYFYCEQSVDLNVVRVFMEFAAGGTLQGLLAKRGKLPFGEFQSLLRDITEGLAYIHSQHYVHCDIKTANVLLSQDRVGKIGDFGTARTVRPGQQLYDMQGSPLYMSPECMAAGEIDSDDDIGGGGGVVPGARVGYSFPTDVWSLGCVVLEMSTNRPPFSHIGKFNGPAGFTSYITSLTDTPDLSPLFDAPPSVVEFVSACLNPDPARRATAQQLLQMSVFSEADDDTTNSAVQALQRAQLLHVLNKFVAFQDPTDSEDERDAKRRAGVPTRRGFFDSSSSSSSDDEGDGGSISSPTSSGGSRAGSGGSSSSSDDSDELMMVNVKLGGGQIITATAAGAPAAHRKASHKKKGKSRKMKAKRGVGFLDSSSASSSPSSSPEPEHNNSEDGDSAGAGLGHSRAPKRRSKTLSKPRPPCRHEAAEAAFFASSSSSSSPSSAPEAAAAHAVPDAIKSSQLPPRATKVRPSPPPPQQQQTPSLSSGGASSPPWLAGGPPRRGAAVAGLLVVPASEGAQTPRSTTADTTSTQSKRTTTTATNTTTHPSRGPSAVLPRLRELRRPLSAFSPLLAASFFGRNSIAALAAQAAVRAEAGGQRQQSHYGGGGRGESLASRPFATAGQSLASAPGPVPMAAAAAGLAPSASATSYMTSSFNANMSFRGANMEDVLNDAANDIILNLASPPTSPHDHDTGGGAVRRQGELRYSAMRAGRSASPPPPTTTTAAAAMAGWKDSPSSIDGDGDISGATVNTRLAVPPRAATGSSSSGGGGGPRLTKSPSPLPPTPLAAGGSVPTATTGGVVETDNSDGFDSDGFGDQHVSGESRFHSPSLVRRRAFLDPNDIRQKIACKLRAARSAAPHRTFFRVENLRGGPLGGGGAREPSGPALTRSRTHTDSPDDGRLALQLPTTVGAAADGGTPSRGSSAATSRGGSPPPPPLGSLGRAASSAVTSRAGSAGRPPSATAAAATAAVVAPQPLARRWLDSIALTSTPGYATATNTSNTGGGGHVFSLTSKEDSLYRRNHPPRQQGERKGHPGSQETDRQHQQQQQQQALEPVQSGLWQIAAQLKEMIDSGGGGGGGGAAEGTRTDEPTTAATTTAAPAPSGAPIPPGTETTTAAADRRRPAQSAARALLDHIGALASYVTDLREASTPPHGSTSSDHDADEEDSVSHP